MNSLVVIGGLVAAEYGTFRADIVICDGRIAALVDDASGVDGPRFDAGGAIIFPGGVDIHTHLREPSKIVREGFYYGTASAAAGGITTVVEMPQADPLVQDVDGFRTKLDMASKSSILDFGLYAAAVGQSDDELAALLREGVLAFKAFMCASSPGYPRLDDAALLECLHAVRRLDSLLIVHAENDALLQAGLARMAADGRTDALAHADSRPPIVETTAITTVVRLAEEAGARLHVAHVSTVEGALAVAAAHARGAAVTCETCPQYLLMDLDDLARLGPLARCAPAIRERAEVEALWPLLLDGRIGAVASDHSPYTYDDKEQGRDDIFKATLGLNVIQVMLPVVFDEGVQRRGLSYRRFAEFSAAEPARIVGLYPRKGSITIGADADLAIWDPDATWQVRREQLLSRFPWTPFEGRTLRGRVTATIRRGEFVYRDGRICAEPGSGTFLHGSPAVPRPL